MTRLIDHASVDNRREAIAQARITLVISGLVVGGAERILTALANGWVESGRPVALVTLDAPDRPPFFPVDPRVEVHRLALAGVSRNRLEAILNNVRRLVVLRRAISRTRPNVVVSFMDRTNVLTLFATTGAGWPIIVADRSAGDPRSGSIWRILRDFSYRRARWVVVQTERRGRALPAHLRRQTVVIPNPVLAGPLTLPLEAGDAKVDDPVPSDPYLVVALGRLVPQKGFDLLIEAFASVVRREPAARLEIWGAGPEADGLRSLIIRRGLDARVKLAGETKDPATVLRRAGVFVLSSRVEGFPNVLLEAMALGRPVIAVDCAFGPGEIIRDGVDGRLVPPGDVEGLAEVIVELLASPERAEGLGARAIEVRQRFAFGEILGRWSNLVDSSRMSERA